MASNINLIFILVLTFYASNGSLLLIREESDCNVSECERPDPEHSIGKRSADPYDESDAEDPIEWPSASDENDLLQQWEEFWTRFKLERILPYKYLSSWRKRNEPEDHSGGGDGTQYHNPNSEEEMLTQRLTSQFVFRVPRAHRQYDVPQIECPQAEDGMDRFACPSPDRMGRYRCIDDHLLCDGFIDCPEGEDEDRQACMFYKTMKAHLDILADAVLRWARGR